MTAQHRSAIRRAPAAVATAVAAALVLTACGSSSDNSAKSTASASASSSAAAHNTADVTFATDMIPHHRQAVEMAALAAGRASSASVKTLAEKIEKAQDPEINTMSGWLKAWGKDVPTDTASSMGSSMGSMPGMASSGTTTGTGMMSSADMTMLKKASGKAFDSAFLTMMVQHHQGAVAMAKTELSKGSYGPARTMAQDIISSQTAEISLMKGLLGSK
jgi:uncharacterized protein (DUF305 family)